MKIVIDNAIPFITGVFEPFANVIYKNGASITKEDVKDADALLIRTRTLCDKNLLIGSKVKIISTATIGTDHINLEWCKHNGIIVKSAAGCNAGGVMQYVFTALYYVADKKNISLQNKTLGVIGVGNTGGRVANAGEYLGYKVLRCDPPRAEKEGGENFCDIDYLLNNSDIVSVHVPLLQNTINMVDKTFLSKLKNGSIFINSSRGEVINEAHLSHNLNKLSACILDVWQNEPHINLDLLHRVDIGTNHIAGYSYQGKQNGTAMAVRAIAKYFNIEPLKCFMPKTENINKEIIKLNLKAQSQTTITQSLINVFNIQNDCDNVLATPQAFEELRNNYDYRPEIQLI